ncbi:MAG: phenylalanine--tRNA ligase subunit alpha, partial [Candidatus Nealsonbacteria bacterium]|nr:phenylalanine--tRNA ligase subunit alpha [Candidatus Nealsonbacteria bacterium]
MLQIDLKSLKKQAESEIESAGNIELLNEVSKKYLGKKGELTLVLRSLVNLSKVARKEIGSEANKLKDFLNEKIKARMENVSLTRESFEESEWIDITIPGKRPFSGHLHPLTLTKRKVEEIFQSMGFFIVEGPDMENEWYNFDALNIPKDHPARDVWDTFYLKNKLLLRTHTSPVQVRYMEKNNPPLRIIVPGNVFRHEATDSSHEFQLFQVEGLMVDKSISVANLKAIVGEFFRRFFEKDVKFRLRPDYFPFTEPSFDIAISCFACQGKGCSVCKSTGWLEVAGAGMVHPNVFKNSKLIPKDWQGWAFGFGLERLAMLKYKINDIRL